MTEHGNGDNIHVRTDGRGAPAIGKVSRLFLSVFAGDVSDLTGRAKPWSGWNWPPFVLVVGLGSTALITAPVGPARQFHWVWAASAISVAMSFVRVVGVPGGRRSALWRPLLTASSLLLAVVGLTAMRYLADHGEIAVTARISPSTATNGSTLQVVVDSAPQRAYLRLRLSIDDADDAGGRQACTPSASYTAQRVGGGDAGPATGKRSGEAVEFRLGGSRDDIRVRVTLTVDEGCAMKIAVTDAALHD